MAALTDERTQFQVDRLAYFSDAVFAIAITLLVFNIRAPALSQADEPELLRAIGRMVPAIIGFALSFFVVSNYWRAHHRLFGWVSHHDDTLVTVNLLLLFFVSFIPCPTAFYSDHPNFRTPLMFYAGSLAVVGLLQFNLARYLLRRPDLLRVDAPVFELWLMSRRALVLPVVCILAGLSAMFDLWLARAMLMLIPVFMRIFTRVARRKSRIANGAV